jgi:hypothetical protein
MTVRKWEYLQCRLTSEPAETDKLPSGNLAPHCWDLDMLGDDGWELAAVTAETESPHHLYFKRPKQ